MKNIDCGSDHNKISSSIADDYPETLYPIQRKL